MNINIMDINKMALNMEKMIKQLEKNKVKYPIGLTYDQQYQEITSLVEKGAVKEFKIVRIM